MLSKKTITFYAICLTFLFSLGLMLIDYGTSLKTIKECSNIDIYLQSLIFHKIEPRVAYHLGIVIVVLTYLAITMLLCLNL